MIAITSAERATSTRIGSVSPAARDELEQRDLL
jgi:hypothetical protein